MDFKQVNNKFKYPSSKFTSSYAIGTKEDNLERLWNLFNGDFWSGYINMYNKNPAEIIQSFLVFPFPIRECRNGVEGGPSTIDYLYWYNFTPTSKQRVYCWGNELDTYETHWFPSIKITCNDYIDLTKTHYSLFLPYYGTYDLNNSSLFFDIENTKDYTLDIGITLNYLTGEAIYIIVVGNYKTQGGVILPVHNGTGKLLDALRFQLATPFPISASDYIEKSRNIIQGAFNLAMDLATATAPTAVISQTSNRTLGSQKVSSYKTGTSPKGDFKSKTDTYYGSRTSSSTTERTVRNGGKNVISDITGDISQIANNIVHKTTIEKPSGQTPYFFTDTAVSLIKIRPKVALMNNNKTYCEINGSNVDTPIEVNKSTLKYLTDIVNTYGNGCYTFGSCQIKNDNMTEEEKTELEDLLCEGIRL